MLLLSQSRTCCLTETSSLYDFISDATAFFTDISSNAFLPVSIDMELRGVETEGAPEQPRPTAQKSATARGWWRR
jgi:hypothetical protein